LRARVLAWLKAELEAWAVVAMTTDPGAKERVAQALIHWKSDPDLAGIRDDAGLAELPAEQRAAFKRLWIDVDALLAKLLN
jgi:hypothetical protein